MGGYEPGKQQLVPATYLARFLAEQKLKEGEDNNVHIELDAVIYEVPGSVDSSSHHNNRKQAPRPLGAWCWGWGIRIEFPGTSYEYPSDGGDRLGPLDD